MLITAAMSLLRQCDASSRKHRRRWSGQTPQRARRARGWWQL